MSFLGGLLWDPLKKATGLTDAQMAGIGALAVAAPFALPAAAGATGAGAAGTAGAAGSSLTGGLLNFSGAQAAAPIADMSMKATAADVAGMSNGGGLLSSMTGGLDTVGQYAKPIGNIAGAASQANGLLSQGQPQIQPPQIPQYQDMSGLLSTAQQNPQLAQLQAQRAKRRGLLGGTYG